MAITPKFRDQILARVGPDWQEMYASGEIDDNDLEQFARARGMQAPVDFSNVQGGNSSVGERELPAMQRLTEGVPGLSNIARMGELGVDAAVGGAERLAGGIIGTVSDSDEDLVRATLGGLAVGRDVLSGDIGALLRPDYVDAARNEALSYGQDRFRRGLDTVAAARQAARTEAPFGETMSVGLVDVASQPSQLASLVGGPLAALPAADAYTNEYMQARMNNVPKEEAAKRAGVMAGTEFATEAIPFKMGKLDAFVPTGDLGRFVARTVGRGAFEGASEAATTGMQVEIDRAISKHAEGEKLREFAKSQVPTSGGAYATQAWESFVAGAIGGTAFSAPGEAMRVAAERGAEVSRNLDNAAKFAQRERDIDSNRQAVAEEATARAKSEEQAKALNLERMRLSPEARRMADQRMAVLQGRLQQEQERYRALVERRNDDQYRQAMGEGAAPPSERTGFDEREVASAKRSRDNIINAMRALEERIRVSDEASSATLAADVNEQLEADRKQSAAGEAAKLLSKQRDDLVKKTKKQHARDRSVALRSFQQEANALPEDDRADFLADRISQWDQDNALEKRTLEAQSSFRNTEAAPAIANPVAQREAVRASKPDATPEQVTEAVAKSNKDGDLSYEQLMAANLERRGGLASVDVQNITNDLDTQQVMTLLRERMGKGSARVLNKLMSDGNLVVVSDASYLPEGAEPRAEGWYDGKTTYVVANKLDKKNVIGDMLNIAAHEVKHGADLGGKVTMGGFIGEQANKSIVSKIRALAKQDPSVAQLVQHVESVSQDPVVAQLELPAHFIKYAREARSNRNLVARIGADIVSSVRTKAKDLLGDTDVNINDVAYLSDKLLQNVAVNAPSLQDTTGTIGGLASSPFQNNASGESSASIEAINRVAEERDLGRDRVLIDRDGTARPLRGVDAVDTFAREEQVIVQKNVGRDEWTVISSDPNLSQDRVAGIVNRFKSQPQEQQIEERQAGEVDLSAEFAALGLASISVPKAVQDAMHNKDRYIHNIKRMLTSFGGLGRELGVTLEDAKDYSVSWSHRAANYDRQLSRGMTRMAKRRGGKNWKAERDSVVKEVAAKLQQIGDLPLERRESAILGYARENPELRALPGAMRDINMLSRTLLHQYMKAHPNPTPEQLALMNKFHRNTFKYSTNIYAVFQGDEGTRLAERIKKEYQSAEREISKGNSVSDTNRKSYELWKRAADYLIDNDITIPENMDRITQSRLDNLYHMWVPQTVRVADTVPNVKAVLLDRFRKEGMTITQAEAAVREKMKADLEVVRPDVTDAQLKGKADAVIDALLGIGQGASPVADYYRGAKQDRTILETREDLPEEIQELLGLITDPSVRLAVTLAKQGELAGRTKFLLEMKANGVGKWVIPESDVGKPGTEKFSHVLSGENFGPLEGWRTTREIAEAIGDNLQMYSSVTDAISSAYFNPEAAVSGGGRLLAQAITKTAAVGKLTSIVMDGYNALLNGAGSWLMLAQNGMFDVWNPATRKAISGAGKTSLAAVMDVVYSPDGMLSPAFEDAVRYGLLDSARAQEIRRTPFEHVKRLISRKGPVGKLWGGTLAVKNVGVEAFAMTDAWVKVAAFQKRVEVMTNYYAAAGIQRTSEQIKREAADVIKDTNIGFSRTPGAVRLAERVGAVTFLPYFVSVYRSIGYSAAQGYKDWEQSLRAPNPEAAAILRREAMNRLAGTAFSTAGFTVTLKALAALAAGASGEDEENLEAMKKLMYEDARYADSVYAGKDETGIPTFVRLSRLDPNGPVNDLLRIAIDPDLSAEEKITASRKTFFGLIFQNRATAAAIKGFANLWPGVKMDDKKTRIERIFPAGMDRMEDAVASINPLRSDVEARSDAESLTEFLDTVLPGWFDAVDKDNRPGQGNATSVSNAAATFSKIAVLLGGKMDKADGSLAFAVAANNLEDIRKVGRAELEEARKGNRSMLEITTKLTNWMEREHEAALKVKEVYGAMVSSGIPRSQISEIIKDTRAMKEEDVSLLIGNRMPLEADQWAKKYTRLVSPKAIESTNRVSDIKSTQAERKEEQEARKLFIAKMKALGVKVQDDE